MLMSSVRAFVWCARARAASGLPVEAARELHRQVTSDSGRGSSLNVCVGEGANACGEEYKKEGEEIVFLCCCCTEARE